MRAAIKTRNSQNPDTGSIILFLIVLALLPLLWASLSIYDLLAGKNIHSALMVAAVSAPTVTGLYLLWISKAFRVLYVLIHAVTVCLFTVLYVVQDKVWATIACSVILAGELYVARMLYDEI